MTFRFPTGAASPGRRRGEQEWLDRNRPAGWRPGTFAAAAVVVLALTAGAVALRGDDNGPAAAPASPSPLAAPVEDFADVAEPAVALEDQPSGGHAEPLLVAPEGVSWQLFTGVALPYSRTAGPTTADGPVYGGFARSQTGVLLAAVHLGTRYLLTPGEGWREVVARQVLPGVGRDVFVRNRAGVDPQAPAGTYGQIAGFRIVTWTPEVGVVQLVSRFPTSGVLQVTTTTVRWAGGDWRLQLQPDGGTSPTAQAVGSLDGFVVWGA